MSKTSRRDFIKSAALAGGALPLLGSTAIAETVAPSTTEQTPGNTVAATSFTILYTSDIHAQLFTHDEFFWERGKAVYRKRGGMAVLKTMIESFRKRNPANTILIDGGDYIHGSALASLSEGEALIPVINSFQYDVIVPGNWEVVYKKEKMLFDLGHATAAKICANMWHKNADGSKGETVYQPYWIKYIAGIKVGFIGYTDHLIPRRQSPAYSEGLLFGHPQNHIVPYVKYLREKEGCALIFLVTHIGLAQQVGLANNPVTEGVDFILGADTHERLREPIEGKYTRVVECGAFGSFLGKLDIQLENGKLKNFQYQLLDVDPAKYKADKALQTLIENAYAPHREGLQRVLGTTTTPLVRYFVMETPMDNLITDAIMWKFKPDIALSNGFRFCQPLAIDATKNSAAITKEFLWNMLPVDSEAKTGMVTGQQLWNWLEKELQNAFAKDPAKRFGGWFVRFAGMEVNFTIGNEDGKRLNWVKVNGEPLDLTKQYSVVACEREGDPDDTLCRIEHVQNPKRLGNLLHDVIEEYLKVNSPVAPVLEKRATATDEPHTLLTQLRGTTYEFR
jgi:S-sulfosulfanyl-L-cysteine sulfohydrolase